MITAVDTCVLLDLLLDDPRHRNRSHAALTRARREGQLVVCELVVAELGPVLEGDPKAFLNAIDARFVPCGLEASLEAAVGFHRHLKAGGKRGRVVADYLIAAHAKHHAQRLLTRDKGFKRTALPSIELWYP